MCRGANLVASKTMELLVETNTHTDDEENQPDNYKNVLQGMM